MEDSKFQDKIMNATKWSTITEIAAKLVSPITNMVLARILAPEAFGVIATVTMIVSFAEMFTDAGFQKYLVQHNFKSEQHKFASANAAFWTNLGISIIIWMIIVLFRDVLSMAVGNPGLGIVVSIASIQIILSAFSSIHMALYRREFDFKNLFLIRMVTILVPFFVTIPLALLGMGYWSLIIGTMSMQVSNAILLNIKSKWKPTFSFELSILKEMLSFSVWSLVEAISIWATTWIDTFIIGSLLNPYYLGLYKTSTTMVNSIMALVRGATTPVLFSTLSRLQSDEERLNDTFLKFQRTVSIIIFPLGVGVFLYRDLVTQILLGNQWSEASDIVGVWALTSAIVMVFGSYCSELYRALGKPKLSFLAQILHLVVLVPVLLISSRFGFWPLVYARSLTRLQLVLVHFCLMKFVIKFPILKLIKNVLPSAFSALTMGMVGFLLQKVSLSITWSLISIILCILSYFLILMFFPKTRKEIIVLVHKLTPKIG